MNRRNFITWVLSFGFMGWLSSMLYSLLAYLRPPKSKETNINMVKVGKIDDIPPDSGQIIKFGREPVILIRTEEGDFRAFSAICTHLACIVQYRADTNYIWCACHNGIYDLNGKNIAGPPPRPLAPYAVKIINNELFITRQNVT